MPKNESTPALPPDYWRQASRELARCDAVMKRLVRRFDGTTLTSRGDAFATLARSIIGQQISVKAAESIWQRVVVASREMTPRAVLKLCPATLTQCGLSRRKVEYLHDLARHFQNSLLRVADWPQLSDDEVIRDLIQVHGIGRWTAEMFLIFNLQRPNVLPLDDIGLQRAAGVLYFNGESPTRKQMISLAQQWQPWCSVATWYLWRSLDPVLVEY